MEVRHEARRNDARGNALVGRLDAHAIAGVARSLPQLTNEQRHGTGERLARSSGAGRLDGFRERLVELPQVNVL